MMYEVRGCVMMGEYTCKQNKKVSSTVKMEDSGQNFVLFNQI